ncbi:hypothetical protein CEXT_393751 [Caerostris extrusa]|uniref:Uncharacterized protein n=1 Tax=Caerostris extrusa TaxID=172846 RepID=A0AAV4XM40_CAEEX|nr:hypothetical protein CEXT_393751 [Caerostris extrusa]
MAQVLLDQTDNQLRLKRGLYEIAKKLLTSDLDSENDSDAVSNRLRRRENSNDTNNAISAFEDISLTPDLSIQEDLEDSESCDDPDLPDILSIDSNEPFQNKSKG